MAIVFLSHSSEDDDQASVIKDQLAKAGFGAVFLDVDEAGGIRPGRHWRDELARELRTADAIVFLGSASSETSIWCAAELAVAKTLEKFVLPVQLEDTARHELLNDEQWVVFTGDFADTISRLIRELERRPRAADAHRWQWDDQRSPFPGLRTFGIEDAGVFFGRDGLIDDLVAIVDPVAALDHTCLIAVVGPSGTGKSSLVRAGLTSALLDRARLGSRWLVVPPFVPALDSRQELGKSLGAAGLDADMRRSYLSGEVSLRTAVAALVESQPDADKALLVLDQAEELVGRDDRVEILSDLADAARDGAACRVVMTVREGFVGRLLSGLELDGRVLSMPVTAMSRTSLASAIEGPARRADLVLEDGLVQAILDDVGTGDALPLLALALDRTYRGAVADGTRILRIERYRSSGGVAGAVGRQAGEAASRIGANGEERAIEVLVPMASVDEEGNWIRRTIKRSSLDDDQWIVVQALEDARLVVVGGDDSGETAAVTHSAIFAAWPPMARALDTMADDLRFQRRLERDSADWDRDGRPRDQLPRGTHHRQLQSFRARHPRLTLEPVTEDYLASAARLSSSRRARAAVVVGAVAVLAVLASLLAVGQLQERARTSAAVRVAEARQGIARALNEPRFDRAMRVGMAALERDPSRDGAEAILGIVLREPAFRGYVAPAMPYAGRAVAWTADHSLLVGDAQGGVVTVAPNGSVGTVAEGDGTLLRTVVSDPAGTWVATGDRLGGVRLWADAPAPSLEFHRQDGTPAHTDAVADLVAVGPDRLVSAGHDGDVVLWDTTSGDPVWVAPVGDEVWSMASLPGVDAMVAGTRDGAIVSIALGDGSVRPIAQLPSGVHSIAGIGEFILAGDAQGAGWLVDRDATVGADDEATGDLSPIFQGELPVRAIAPIDSERVLTGWTDGSVRLIDRRGRVLDDYSAHDEPIRDIAYDRDTGWFAVTGDDGLVSRWELTGDTLLLRSVLSTTADLVGDADDSGRLFITGTTRRLSVLEPDGDADIAISGDLGGSVRRIDVNDDGTVAALGFADRAIAVDTATGRLLAEVDPGGAEIRVAIMGTQFVAAGTELVITELETGDQQRLAIPAELTVNSLHADAGSGTIIVGAQMPDLGGVVLVWRDGATTPVRRDIGQAGVIVQGLDVDDAARWLVVGRNDGRAEVWNLDEMTPTGVTFTRHGREITDIAFVPSSATVVSLDAGGAVWLWSAEDGTSFAEPIRTGLDYGRRLLVNDDGTVLTTIGRGGVVDVPLDAATIQQLGCALAALECPPAPDLLTVLREP